MMDISHEGEKLDFQLIHIISIIKDEIGVPRNNGTPGSALYSVPLKLSHTPPPEWERFFLQAWDHPSEYTSMHRPGIASIFGDKVILNGTTIEEIEKYHKKTLKLAEDQANRLYQEFQKKEKERQLRDQKHIEEHKRKVVEAAKKIKFD